MNTDQAIYGESDIAGIPTGDERDQYAVNMQIARTVVMQVASGYAFTLGGGYFNGAFGDSFTVGGGFGAIANKYGQNAYASGRFF